MADKIKKETSTDNATLVETTENNVVKTERKVTVKLPRLPGQNANQEEFFSVNGKNYMIKRGIEVEVPEALAEVIYNADKADEYAMRYVDSLATATENKEKELGIK